jgi:heme oxygenase
MNIAAPALSAVTLTEALKEQTGALHTTAERSGVINDILRKKADRHGYALLLRNLLPAYRAMEQALERLRDRAVFSAFATPALYRGDRIAADLTALTGAGWDRELPLLPEATLYAARVTAASEGDGGRLVAHAYVRYFGDLSGGQVMKRMLGQAMNLGAEELSFYDFPEIADHAAFKNQMRTAIDVDVAAHCAPEAVIDEAKRAFEHNIAVSAAVQGVMAGKDSR